VAFGCTTPAGTAVSDGFLWILRLIRAFGSPNLVWGEELCAWHRDFVTPFTFGVDIGTPDFDHTGCLLLWGHNPATAYRQPRGRKRGAWGGLMSWTRGAGPRPAISGCAPKRRRARAGAGHRMIGRLVRSRLHHDWSNGAFLVRAPTAAAFSRRRSLRVGSPGTRRVGSGRWRRWRPPPISSSRSATRSSTAPCGA
jgi:hypothetical protein